LWLFKLSSMSDTPPAVATRAAIIDGKGLAVSKAAQQLLRCHVAVPPTGLAAADVKRRRTASPHRARSP
jgi:hypothetical protein